MAFVTLCSIAPASVADHHCLPHPLMSSRWKLASSSGPFSAFQCCTLKSGRAWYAKSHDGERRWKKVQTILQVKGHQSTTVLANNKRHSYIAVIQVKDDPSMAQTVHLYGTDSIEMAWFCWLRSTYFSFASCHITIDHHDMPHVTSHTRPSRFSACNIEKLGMGLGVRLDGNSIAWLLFNTKVHTFSNISYNMTDSSLVLAN